MRTESDIADQLFDELTRSQKPRRAVLVVLCGLPYSGKSTVARTLQEVGFVHVWLTVIKKRFSLNDETAHSVAKKLIKRLLENSYMVAFDFLNHTAEIKDQYSKLASDAGADYKIIWVNTDIEEINTRQALVEKSGGTEGRSVIGRNVIDEIARQFEEPSGSNVLEVKEGNLDELEDWLASNKLTNDRK